MRIEPFLHRVLVKPDDLEETDPTFKAIKAAGLQIPESIKEKERYAITTGIVLEVGKTCFKDYGGDPSWLKKGERVIYAKYGGKEIPDPNHKDKKLALLSDEDIVGVYRDE